MLKLLLIALPLTAVAAPASVSLGTASGGRLEHGVRLPDKGPHHRIYGKTRRRGAVWGTQELVGVLRRAAAAVAAVHPGSRLLVGNLSRRGGGDLSGSRSHNSGRDADLPFYLTDAAGRRRDSEGFVLFDGRGRAGALRFDVERNWLLVKALLQDTQVQVQWVFCANALRHLMLDHARQAKEPAELVARAEQILGEPGNSSPPRRSFSRAPVLRAPRPAARLRGLRGGLAVG